MNLFKKLKAQIALEALLIIGVLVIGVIIFATFYFQSITPKDQVDFEFGSDRVFNKTPNSPLVIIGDPDPGDPEDPEIPEVHTFSDLVLILDPETSSLVNQDFNIIARINSDYGSANVDLIEVTKYDEITNSFVNPTNSCELNGVYADSFSNAGTLDPSGTNKLSKTFTFSCNSPGKYDFLFTVYNENEIVPLVKNLEQSGYTDGKEIEIDTLCLAGQPGGGTGTEEDPKIICTPKELHDVRDHLDWYYVLGQDIDLNHTILSNDPTATWYDDVNGWRPIGEGQNIRFYGGLNGNNFVIKNLYINRPLEDFVGLFSYIECSYNFNCGVFKNLNLTNFYVVGDWAVGSLAGSNEAHLLNIKSFGILGGNNIVGGLVGYNNGYILNSEFDGQINYGSLYSPFRDSNVVGGLVGRNYRYILNSFAKGKIYGYGQIGGLAGENEYGHISNSFFKGDVAGGFTTTGGVYAIGGLVGYNTEGHISNCFSDAYIFGARYNGGLIGGNRNGSVSNSYSRSKFNNAAFSAGLIAQGANEILIKNSYWDKTVSNINNSGGGIERTTDDMTYIYDNNTFLNWDFENYWVVDSNYDNDGYPYLKMNTISLDSVWSTDAKLGNSAIDFGTIAPHKYFKLLENMPDFNLGAISFWVKTPIYHGQNNVLFDFNCGLYIHPCYVAIGKYSDGSINIYNFDFQHVTYLWNPPYDLNHENYNHILINWNSGDNLYNIYLNGVLQAISNSGNHAALINVKSLNFGALPNVIAPDLYALNKVDEIGVWSRTLSSEEILDIYNSGNALAYPLNENLLNGLKMYYTLDEGYGEVLVDSKNGFNLISQDVPFPKN